MLYEQIRHQLKRYLSGELSLEQFKALYIPLGYNLQQSQDLAATALGSEIDLRLAEHSNGHWTEDELREQLRRMALSYAAAGSAVTATQSQHSAASAVQAGLLGRASSGVAQPLVARTYP